MPIRAGVPCRYPGCPAVLPRSGYCQTHQREEYRQQDRQRLSSRERGYDSTWQRESRAYLAENPLCATCQAEGWVTAATIVDHVKPHHGNQQLFWDRSNWRSSCKPCHDAKTARESAFGRGPAWSKRR